MFTLSERGVFTLSQGEVVAEISAGGSFRYWFWLLAEILSLVTGEREYTDRLSSIRVTQSV